MKNRIYYSNYNIDTNTIVKKYINKDILYVRKYELNINDDIYYFKKSNYHIEIDFELIIPNTNSLWNEIYNNICEFSVIQKKFIVVLKNIESVDYDFLEKLYIYLRNPYLSFFIFVKHYSFLPQTIKKKSEMIVIKKTKNEIENRYYINDCIPILKFIEDPNENNIIELRESIYNLLVKNYPIYLCIEHILISLYKYPNIINNEKIIEIIEHYNNNFRPIYHLERLFVYLKITLEN